MLRLQRLRFTFATRDPLRFPAGQAGNTLRGAFGLAARRLFCSMDCPGAGLCPRAAACEYARIFEPKPSVAAPSGLADLPRPYVIQAEHLSGSSFVAGQDFSFHVNLFDLGHRAAVVEAFRTFEGSGLGARRSGVRFMTVTCDEISVDLRRKAKPVRRMLIRYRTPTTLKGGTVPTFELVAGRVRDRVGALSQFYGEGLIPIDFDEFGRRAALVTMTRCELRTIEGQRRSSRTGYTHAMGGFVGEAEYEGNLTEFVPFFEAARYTGVGRHASWGNGQIEIEC